MCGIIGIFNSKEAGKKIVEGLEIIKHRGKDDYGYSDGKTVFSDYNEKFIEENYIGHCLHAIVGHVKQPIKNHGVKQQIPKYITGRN